MTSPGLLSEWARTLVETLADAGVELAVVSPGSRSTPLVWALTASERLAVHVVHDERSAAFFAVGHAKVTGFPALLVCTSGSAAAHYLPAVVEAAHARTPLVVLTADRPPELHGCAAPQTIDQTELYGRHARSFVELGMPDPAPEAFRGLRRVATQAVRTALGPHPGPVHLNFKARKPLEPPPIPTNESRAVELVAVATLSEPITRSGPPRLAPEPSGLDEVASALRAARRPLFVAGPAPLGAGSVRERLYELARRTGAVLLAEATSQLRFVGDRAGVTVPDAFVHILACETFRSVASRADCIVQLGRPPTAAAWEHYVAAAHGTPRFVLADDGWPDPQGSASTLVVGDANLVLEGLLTRLDGQLTAPDAEWHAAWRSANDATWDVVAAHRPSEALSETGAMAAVLEALPDDALLCIGNSLPVRHVDRVRAPGRPLMVWSQRGANGIDGLVAGASGAVTAAARPAALVLGDVSFLHDLGGLWCAREVRHPLAIVVLHNDGGRIFEQLPAAGRLVGDPDRLAAWVTPHGIDLVHAARLFGVEHLRPESMPALHAGLRTALARPGATVIEVRVPPSGAVEESRRLLPEIARRVGGALRESGG